MMAGNRAQAVDPLMSTPRRSVTLPLRTSETPTSQRTSLALNSDPQVETLFAHPSVRIVSFTTTSTWAVRPNSKNGALAEEEAGTLPWTSSLERLIAVGPLHIYRPHGSVAFLNCGKVMHPILPKSQCWCVDDDSSKFVLQIRRPQYWRIEIPVTDLEDFQRSKRLKEVFCQVLQFEKTACPFQRTFIVELPEAPATPVKKRPWRPVERSKAQMNVNQVPEDVMHAENGEDYFNAASDDDNKGHRGGDSDGDATDDTNATPRNVFGRSTLPLFLDEESSNNSSDLLARRSVTAPPQLTIVTSTPPKAEKTSPPAGTISANHSSPDYSSSVESFHTVQSWHSPITPLPPSPPESNPASPTTYPYPHDNIALPKRPIHPRETSELTVTPETPRVWEIMRNPSSMSVKNDEEFSSPTKEAPRLANETEENLDDEHLEISKAPREPQQIRHRPTTGSNSRRRNLSPLPPAASLFSTPRRRQRYRQTARHLPTAIIQKTCEILLSPPSHLLRLMFDVAAKIAAGEWRGMVFGYDEEGEEIVGQWDDKDRELAEEECLEDDFGAGVIGRQDQSTESTLERVGRSWEVD